MAQVIFTRVVLTVLAISLAIGLGMGLARAQTPGATFVFHGDVTAERQAEIRAEWADVAAWLLTEYGLQWSFDHHDQRRVRPRSRSRASWNPGTAHPPANGSTQAAWCSSMLRTRCVRSGPRHRRHGRTTSSKRGHVRPRGRSGWDALLVVYARSRYAESRGESLESRAHRTAVAGAGFRLERPRGLETSDAFWANYTTPDRTRLVGRRLVGAARRRWFRTSSTPRQRGRTRTGRTRSRTRLGFDPPRSTRSSPPRDRRSNVS